MKIIVNIPGGVSASLIHGRSPARHGQRAITQMPNVKNMVPENSAFAEGPG